MPKSKGGAPNRALPSSKGKGLRSTKSMLQVAPTASSNSHTVGVALILFHLTVLEAALISSVFGGWESENWSWQH